MKVYRFFIVIFFTTVFLGQSKSVKAQYTEYEIKGAMVYTFAKFVTWPKNILNRSKVLVLGILGDDPFGQHIDRIIKNRKANGLYIEIKRGKTIKDLKGSHILFICNSEETGIESIIDEYKSKYILTIGDGIDDFCKLGGIFNIEYNDGQPVFYINLEAASKAGLIIDTRLLQLAEGFVISDAE